MNHGLALVFSCHFCMVFASTRFVVTVSRIIFYFQLIQTELDKETREREDSKSKLESYPFKSECQTNVQVILYLFVLIIKG